MSDSKDKDKEKNKGKTKNKDKDDNDKEKDRDENKDKDKEKDKDQKEDKEKDKNKPKEKENEKEHERSGSGVFSHFVDAVVLSKSRERGSSTFSEDFKLYKGSYVSLGSPEIITISLETGEINRYRQYAKDDQVGTQRVYKKTSPNSQLTLYLPTRELVSTGNQPAILKGILHADPKNVQGYRLYAQLTLTFRYGREDEEVMGLRFCNEAIMCLHQLWPQNDDLPKETLTPLQEALIKRLGDGAFPFTLTLTPQAPPSVQLVPAKRYYGAPIGTSYEIRCFIADKTDEKFHRRATVRMGVRVIHRTDVASSICGPENFASIINNQLSPPPPHDVIITKQASEPIPSPTTDMTIENLTASKSLPTSTTVTTTETAATISITSTTTATTTTTISTSPSNNQTITSTVGSITTPTTTTSGGSCKHKKSERVDSFPKIRLSPKSFRFSSRFGRSKSEAEKAPNDPFYSYSKSFQDYDTCGGPQGSVDKPFLLQEGRVGLKASLDKAWYTHGEDVIVTINIKNDSRKTVRKVRVCAIQHVDVCMFNNGKFKNVVADSDITSPGERTVGPGGSLNATVILKPQRGPTKNWIALEDSLQRSCEPDEITGAIAASAVRTPTIYSLTAGTGAGGNVVGGCGGIGNIGNTGTSPEDRNVFAIYVSYYVKVKLTLSGMGGELSLKLPFALVHIDSSNKSPKTEIIESSSNRLSITDNESKCTTTTATATTTAIVNKTDKISSPLSKTIEGGICTSAEKSFTSSYRIQNLNDSKILDKIESIDDDVQLHSLNKITTKRKLIRHETLAKDDSSDEDEKDDIQTVQLEDETLHHHQNQIQDDDSKDKFKSKTILPDTKDDDSDNDQINNLQEASPSSPSPVSSSVNKQTTCVQIHSTLS